MAGCNRSIPAWWNSGTPLALKRRRTCLDGGRHGNECSAAKASAAGDKLPWDVTSRSVGIATSLDCGIHWMCDSFSSPVHVRSAHIGYSFCTVRVDSRPLFFDLWWNAKVMSVPGTPYESAFFHPNLLIAIRWSEK